MDTAEVQAAEYAARVAGGSPDPLRERKAVPIRGLRDAGVDVALNVYLAGPPTASQLTYLVAMVQRWYADRSEGKFGGDGFHDLMGPTVDGRVVRWQSDLGSADGARALRELARRLAELPNVTVQRLVLGTEVAG